MYLGDQGRPEAALFELSLYEEQWAANQDPGENSSRQESNKCKAVKSGRSMVLLKTERQLEWLMCSEWVGQQLGGLV